MHTIGVLIYLKTCLEIKELGSVDSLLMIVWVYKYVILRTRLAGTVFPVLAGNGCVHGSP
jgi:hypothetical protein